MRNNSSNAGTTFAVALAGLVLAAAAFAGSSPAAAFGMGGFGHTGGFARPTHGPGAGARAGMRGRHPGSDRIANTSRGGRRPPTEGGRTGHHHRIGRIEIDRSGGPALSAAASNGGGAGGNGGGGGVPPQGERRFVPNQVIVEFAANASAQAIGRLTRRYSLTELASQTFPLIGARLSLWRIGGRRSVPRVVGALLNQGIVAAAQPNYIFALDEEANQTAGLAQGDPAQYVLSKLQVEKAQLIATGMNVPVAVIDSEIDASHPDINGSIVKSYDALGDDTAPQLHGTEMAGAIASHGKLLGIAPGARLLAARAFDNHSTGTSFAIYKCLQWATDNGARVVNMSFAGPADPTLQRMLAAAAAKDIVLVAAAGNDGPSSAPLYPAADPNVIAVTATDVDDHVFKMANRGQYIAVAAPGVEILALAPSDSYQLTTGTSVAAAHVSGIAALLLQRDPSLTPIDVRAILMTTAKPLASGGNADFGAGLVNAYRAVTLPGSGTAGDDDGHAQAKR